METGCEKLHNNAGRLDIQKELEKTNHEIEMEFNFFRKFFPYLFEERKADLKIIAENEIFHFHGDLVKGKFIVLWIEICWGIFTLIFFVYLRQLVVVLSLNLFLRRQCLSL